METSSAVLPWRRDGNSWLTLCAVMAALFVGNCSAWRTSAAEDSLRGKAALRSGDYDKAIEYFESALKKEVDLEEGQAGLLQTMRETGAYREAALRAEEFLSAREGSSLVHLERALIAEAVGDYAAAETHLRRSIELAGLFRSTTRLDAVRELAGLLEFTGRQFDAQTYWDQLLNEYRAGRVEGSRQLGNVAVAAWHSGFIQDAKDIFIDATDFEPGEVSLRALVDFGYLFLDKYNATDALGVFRDCLKINKAFPEALIGIALAKRYESNYEAEDYAMAALKSNPNLVSAWDLLAQVRMEEEDYGAALKAIDKALEINPNSLESLSLTAVICQFNGDASGFALTEEKVLVTNPSYGRFYFTIAENFASRRRYQEAVDFNRKAIALDTGLWAAYASLGMNLTRVGEYDEGRKAIQHAFDGDPFNVWAFNSLELFDQMDTFSRNESEHFVFHMSKEDGSVLWPYASRLAEEAYSELIRRYGFIPKGPLQVEVFPDHGGFAVRTLGLPGLGGALGVCFGKVVAIDSPRARKMGSFNWGTTLWHELTHVITLQMTNHNIPRWYSEGLSVHEEHRARLGWGDNLTAAFVKAYKEKKLLKVSELNSGMMRPKYPEQVALSYYQAALVCQMIEEKFGFEKIRMSLKLFAQNKPAEDVFREALGWDTAAFDREYARFLDERLMKVASHLRFPDEGRVGEKGAGPEKAGLAKLLEKSPEDFFANLEMGRLHRKEGSNAEAEHYLKMAQQLFPAYVEPENPYQLLAEMYLEEDRDDDALAELTAWSRIDETSAEPLIRAAGLYMKRQDWDSAAKLLDLSVYINPYDQQALQSLGKAAMAGEDWQMAVAAFESLVSLDASDPAGAHYNLARALLAAGEELEAKREVLKALEIAPSFATAQELLLKLSGAAE